MTQREAEIYLYYAMSIGEQLLCCGAEVGRVEDTIRRICTAYGAARIDVFSITSNVLATLYWDELHCCTQSRRVTSQATDLHKLEMLNRLSRKICAETPSPDVLQEELEKISHSPQYSFRTLLFVYALLSGSFSVFFGGDFKDMISSAIIGVLLKFLESFVKKGSANPLITVLICSTFGGFLANLSVLLHIGTHADLISIGNIMLLIPGLAFTNSLRDMFSGDIVTGLIRFMESILVAVTIALGFNLSNFLF